MRYGIPQEAIKKDIKENNNRLDYCDVSKPGKAPHYIPIWSTYIISEMLMIAISIAYCIVLGYLIFTYKPDIIDPMEKIKKSFFNIHLVIIFILLIMYFIINKNKKDEIIKPIISLLLLSTILLLIMFFFRIKLDALFIQIDLGLTNEQYEWKLYKLYEIFKIKTYLTLGLHLLFNSILFFQVSKILIRKRKQNRIRVLDDVLFDEEENIKF